MADAFVVMREVRYRGRIAEESMSGREICMSRFMGNRNVAELRSKHQGKGAVMCGRRASDRYAEAGFDSKRVSVAMRPEDLNVPHPVAENSSMAQVLTWNTAATDSLIRVKAAFGNLWARVTGDVPSAKRLPACAAIAHAGVRRGNAMNVPNVVLPAAVPRRRQSVLVSPALILSRAVRLSVPVRLVLSFQPMNGGSAFANYIAFSPIRRCGHHHRT